MAAGFDSETFQKGKEEGRPKVYAHNFGEGAIGYLCKITCLPRGGSRTTATSNMERFVIIVNGRKPLTIITKRSILDVQQSYIRLWLELLLLLELLLELIKLSVSYLLMFLPVP